MKKLMIFSVAALAAVACAKTYDTAPAQEQAIGFGTWTENLTKARTPGTSAFAAGDKFFVYGSKVTGSSEPVTVFDGVPVSTTDGTAWTYSPKRFWDSNTDSYTFYAVSPSEGVELSALISEHDVAAGTFTSKDLTFDGKTNDVLVANKKMVAKGDYGKKVDLVFNHAASLLDLKVRMADGLANSGAKLEIEAVSLENIKSQGHFTVTGYGTSDPYAPTISSPWVDDTDPATTATYTNTSGATSVDLSSPLEVTGKLVAPAADPNFLIQNLVVMPQTFATDAQQLKITYSITTGTDEDAQKITFTDKTYDLILFDVTDYPTDDDVDDAVDYNGAANVTGWAPGTHYTYIITIDANSIEFSATITSWTEANGYHYLIN